MLPISFSLFLVSSGLDEDFRARVLHFHFRVHECRVKLVWGENEREDERREKKGEEGKKEGRKKRSGIGILLNLIEA